MKWCHKAPVGLWTLSPVASYVVEHNSEHNELIKLITLQASFDTGIEHSHWH